MRARSLLIAVISAAAICVGVILSTSILRHVPGKSAAAPAGEHGNTKPHVSVRDHPEWNTYHGNSALLGFSDATLPDALEVLWRYKAGAPVRVTPVVHAGFIFFASARGDVVATDLEGNRVWTHELVTGEERAGEPVRERVEAPIACFDDHVLVGTSRGMLYALDAASGNEKWRTEMDSPVLGTPNCLVKDGKAFYFVIGKGRGILHCIDAASGQVLWRAEETDRCDGSPSVGNGTVAFGSCAAALHVFAADTGKRERNIAIDEDSQVAGGVAIDGTRAFFGCRSGKIIQADMQEGKIVWANTDSKSEVFSTPAVDKDWVVASSNDGVIYALERASGKTRWQFDTKGMPTSAVISGDKTVFAADGELFLLRLNDGAKLCSLKIADEITSPALAGTVVLIGSEDGTVVALGPAKPREGDQSP